MLQGIRPEAFEKVTDAEIKDIIRRCISTTASERYVSDKEYVIALKNHLAFFDYISIMRNN